MSIFNLQSLEEKASTKKIVLAENKAKPKTVSNTKAITNECVFTVTLREVDEISNKVNANIAYDESLPEEVPENPQLMQDMLLGYMETFSNINELLREKCHSLKSSLDILKERLDNIEDDENSKDITLNVPSQYTNLGYFKTAVNAKTLIEDELGISTKETNSIEPIKLFRQNIRNQILGTEEENFAKVDYILALYNLFRLEEKATLTINKQFLINNLHNIYQLPVLFNHDITTLYDYLNDLVKNNTSANDIVIKHVETILQEYSLLYSARADAIVEYIDTIRKYMAMYIEVYGGRDDE